MVDSTATEGEREGVASRDDAPGVSPPATPPTPGAGAVAGLVDALGDWSKEREALLAGLDAGLPGAAEWPALPGLDDVRGLWAQLRGREQVRRALVPPPADAGPLNSRALASRMLRLMQEESPGYLRHFTAYVDMLAGLQVLQPGEASASAGARPGAAAPGRTRAKARRSRGASRPPAVAD
ncbi:DUF2894 domain-containing protein [Luteimonas colneyensis]|uniref:DUF2894 domain-containing protein n=1 Tax=Luteimonas colneyensis TaxID=2762230 RepID=UPI00296AEE38|nr:DUF2894 domain-containing protein [Luteimonas colneyensis]